MTIFGYARVSTNQQELKTQIEKLRKNGATKIFQEKYSGVKRKGRAAIDEVLFELVEGDVLLVTKIDRLARSIRDLKDVIEELNGKGCTIIFIDNSLRFESGKADPMSTLMLNMLGSFAEFERDLIVSRTQEGKDYAKAMKKNYREGRPRRNLSEKKYRNILQLLETHSYSDVAEMTKLNRSTLVRIKQQAKMEQRITSAK